MLLCVGFIMIELTTAPQLDLNADGSSRSCDSERRIGNFGYFFSCKGISILV